MATKEEPQDDIIEFLGQPVKAYMMDRENMGNQKIIYKKTRKRNLEPEPLYVEITLRVPMEFLKGECLMEGLNGIFFFIEPQEHKEKVI